MTLLTLLSSRLCSSACLFPRSPTSILLCFSKTIAVKVIDDEEYEKNKTFFIEIGEPRLVEMSEKKGGEAAPGRTPTASAGLRLPGRLHSSEHDLTMHTCLHYVTGHSSLPGSSEPELPPHQPVPATAVHHAGPKVNLGHTRSGPQSWGNWHREYPISKF